MNKLHCYNIDDVDTVVASSPEDAKKVWCETIGEELEDYDWEPEQIPDDKELKIADGCVYDNSIEWTTKTAGEWAKDGRRFLCSTEC